MKTVRYTEYGPPEVLHLEEVPKPAPRSGEVLIRVYATTVTATECVFRKGKPLFTRLFTGLRRPKVSVLGEELAGIIEATGKGVTRFKEGDAVFGSAGPGFGANSEYLCLPEQAVLVNKPSSMTFEEAASCCDGFLTALPFLRDTGCIQPGQDVLIYGASGSVGSAAVQVAAYHGANVTGVCSTANTELVASLGAGNVIDYTREDFTRDGRLYDVVFDTVGKTTFANCRHILKENGIFLEASVGMGIFPQILWTRLTGGKKAKTAATGLRPPPERIKDLNLLKELLVSGKIKPVIDRVYPLEQIVEAHRYVDKGHKKGNVVIKIKQADPIMSGFDA